MTPSRTLHIDIETFCELDLKECGPYRYAQHPSFEVLMTAYSIDRGPVVVETDTTTMLEKLGGILQDPSWIKIAHNAAFERVCLSGILGLPENVFLDPAQWRDTMALAAEAGYPLSLEKLAGKLGTDAKDTAGTALINLFSKLQKSGDRVYSIDRPEEWRRFVAYCKQDVEVLLEVDQVLPNWATPFEHQVWITDQLINDRGIKVDLQLAEWALEQDLLNRDDAERRFKELVKVANPNSVPQVTAGFKRLGLELPNLRAATIEDTLQQSKNLTEDQRQALQLRQELALVAAKKYKAIINRASSDGRLRGEFFFHGAHTSRWSGRGVQLQNLPRAQVRHPEALILDSMLGNSASFQDLKGLVRSTFRGPFVVADYAAIEARVLAWLAGEQWAIDAFAGGRDIYVETAERMGGLTRAQGKVAVLALGYQGGVQSLRSMGAEGTASELEVFRDQWRGSNPNIVKYWREVEKAFVRGDVAGQIQFSARGNDRILVLPSGNTITYRNIRRRTKTVELPGGITTSHTSWYFDGPRGVSDTYGGRLTENIVQAISRDILADALVNLEKDFDVVAHIHDEVVIEAALDMDIDDMVKSVVATMETSPSWAKDLPLRVEAFASSRYRKG